MKGIYIITNPDGEVYIGKSNNIERRFQRYVNGYLITQPNLLKSMYKHGALHHTFDVLFECDDCDLSNFEFLFWNKYRNLGFKMLNCVKPVKSSKSTIASIKQDLYVC